MEVKGLLVMDVDSTLIQEEVIDLLGEFAGHGSKIAEITERSMRGEFDFAQALEERVNLLKGLPDGVFEQILEKIHFHQGAEKLVKTLHDRGFKVGLVSGGFHEIVDVLAERLGIDYVMANRLEVNSGYLTGKTIGEIVTKETKLAKLKEWAELNHLPLSQTIAMGDGANDLLMIGAAGIGVAFCAKPLVREQATYQIDTPNLYQLIELVDSIEY